MKVSIQSQIAALETAIDRGRRSVTMRASEIELHQRQLQAALETLRWVERNRDRLLNASGDENERIPHSS